MDEKEFKEKYKDLLLSIDEINNPDEFEPNTDPLYLGPRQAVCGMDSPNGDFEKPVLIVKPAKNMKIIDEKVIVRAKQYMKDFKNTKFSDWNDI